MRVLVVEDDAALADVIARGLRQDALAVDVATDGDEALDKAELTAYDVIVLDRDLPLVHGDEVCRRLTAAGRGERILMLTASGTLDDRVTGLSLGADDYLAKPFAMRELVARIHALGRRVPGFVRPLITIGDLAIDVPGRSVTRAGVPITLTRKEFGVLETLAATAGQVVSAEHLLDQVWDENTDPFTNAVRITVMTLRRKLGEPAIIDTVIGSGYRLVPPADATDHHTDHEEAV